MADQNSAQEKTEKATPRKREEARKKGQIAKSQDINAAFNLLGIVAVIYVLQDFIIRNIHAYFSDFYSNNLLINITEGNLSELLTSSLITFGYLVGPLLLAGFLVGVITNLAQVGFLFSPELVKPKLEKINPIAGFKRIFSMRSLVELVKSLLKVAVVGFAVYLVVQGSMEDLIFSIDMEPFQIYELISGLILKVGLTAAACFLVLAVFDYMYQRYEHEKGLRMSKQEMKEEFKQTEGDPYIKGKRREKQRAISMNRMIQAIPEATVVITNPTHLSVAIKYKAGEFDTPVVVGKGAGVVALKIREVATEHGVPIIENKPVAQLLYKNAEIGDQIPVEVYQAIAEILAMVYKIKGKL